MQIIHSPMMHQSIEELFLENSRLKEENLHLCEETELQRGQISNLANINVFAASIVNLTSTISQPTLSQNIKRNISKFVIDARNLVFSSGKNIVNIARNMRDLVIKICNFIYDHLGDIALTCIIVPAITLCVAAVGIAIGGMTGMLQTTILSGDELDNAKRIWDNLPRV